MGIKKPSIVFWCGTGANQKALANKIAAEFEIAGIIQDQQSATNKKKLTAIPGIIWDRFRFRKIYGAWKSLMVHYDQQFPSWPAVPLLKVTTINSEEARAFTERLYPDLVIVSGTSLIKKPLINIPTSIGIINLHTGLSPYVKGGPNCTNWCIANNTFHLVGNTIMWLNEGIDSGNIITTETIDIRHAATLDDAHRMVMEHGHDLYLRAIRKLVSDKDHPSVPQQSIVKGQLFLTKMWTAEKRKRLLVNWEKRKTVAPPFTPKTVSLNP